MRLWNFRQGVIGVSKIYQIIRAEVMKQHRNWFHSKTVYFSLLIWPIITFFNSYYSYKSFDLTKINLTEMNSQQSLITFLITGFFGYLCFWSLVQSAVQMGFERENGTLETIFLSPGNRLSIIYGRALGSLFENIWMFIVFTFSVIIWVKGIPLENMVYVPIAFIILLISATVWGGLMNVIFVFSRDAGILFNIFDEPMSLFSGVGLPTGTFPVWAKVISAIFPLSYALTAIRSMLIGGSILKSLKSVVGLGIVIIIIILLTVWLLNLAEKNARQNGEMTFF